MGTIAQERPLSAFASPCTATESRLWVLKSNGHSYLSRDQLLRAAVQTGYLDRQLRKQLNNRSCVMGVVRFHLPIEQAVLALALGLASSGEKWTDTRDWGTMQYCSKS